MSRPAASLPSSLLLVLLVASGVASARSTDRNQPLDVQSNSNDCSIADDGPCTFTGNVHLMQGTLDIHAARADVQRGGGDIRRVILTGSPVVLTQQLDNGSTLNAQSAKVDYDMSTDTVVFTGSAVIDQPGRGNIAGERIAYNMKTGQVQSGGEGKGQVKMRFLPKNAPPAANPTPPKARGNG
jgi:lipopolysaccharide export system protein LptA